MRPKLKPWHLTDKPDVIGGYNFYCPGCLSAHTFYCNKDYHSLVWEFNGNTEKPSFTPSLLLYTPETEDPVTKEKIPRKTICHLVMTDGIINFCSDCVHTMKGQSVPLMNWPEYYQV